MLQLFWRSTCDCTTNLLPEIRSCNRKSTHDKFFLVYKAFNFYKDPIGNLRLRRITNGE